jgi:HNH endonuclease
MREIPLVNSSRVACVDDEDFDRLVIYRWYLTKGYARRNSYVSGRTVNVPMQNMVLAVPVGFEADHIDFDTLNNTRANLRICTRGQNQAAKRKFTGSSSFKGVYFDKTKGRWRAIIQRDGIENHIGYFRSEIDAALAYDKRAAVVHGEFARLNFPDGIGAESGR